MFFTCLSVRLSIRSIYILRRVLRNCLIIFLGKLGQFPVFYLNDFFIFNLWCEFFELVGIYLIKKKELIRNCLGNCHMKIRVLSNAYQNRKNCKNMKPHSSLKYFLERALPNIFQIRRFGSKKCTLHLYF